MIKLIATDLDGTLLHTDKSLPADFFEVVGELMKRGTVFVAASGRQYDNIYETLRPLSDGMYILGENGGINVTLAEIDPRFVKQFTAAKNSMRSRCTFGLIRGV